MKRWQDRGEVQDSEDEELMLDSPSPERPLKRTKRDVDIINNGHHDERLLSPCDATHGVDEEDEIAWLPAKVANTYGKKGKLTRPTRKQPTFASEQRASDTVEYTPKSISPLRTPSQLDSKQVESNYVSGESTEKERLLPASQSPPKPTSRESCEELDQSLPPPSTDPPPLAQTDPQMPSAPASVISEELFHPEPPATPLIFADDSAISDSDGEDLPDVRDLFAAARHKPISLASSSPLSERDVSPPAPLARHEESRYQGPAELATAQEEIDLHNELLRQSILDGHPTTRRSLRARKDIQLHPYLIDKAKYQRQCKERGIKPVRLVETQMQQDHSQDQPDNSQHSGLQSSSSTAAAPDDLLRGRPVACVRLDSASPPADHEFSIERTAKRRRINDRRGRAARQDVSDRLGEGNQMHYEAFSMPPSPPKTSSETSTPGVDHHARTQMASGFRRPPDLTPVALPTPNVSSQARRGRLTRESPTESIPASERRLERTRSRDITASDSEQGAASETEVESEGERIVQRLRREQKRIRGVLPASWLRIDFQARQQPKLASLLARPQLSTAVSPKDSHPQRGVAKRISSTRALAIKESDIATTNHDDSADSDDDSVQLIRTGLKQSHLPLHDDYAPSRPQATTDDADMENDFVDAMLAGPDRRLDSAQSASRQSRVTNKARKGPSNPFSEEQKTRQHSGRFHRAATRRNRNPAKAPLRSSVKLSIADTSGEVAATNSAIPPFVRLALRQARKLSDQGRHSPTHKVLCLATAEDTRDANSVLKSWREGTLVPQSRSAAYRSSRDSTPGDRDPAASLDSPIPRQRWPLAEVNGNVKERLTISTPGSQPDSRANPTNKTRRLRLQHRTVGAPWARATRLAYTGPDTAGRPRGMQIDTLPRGIRDAQLETLQDEFDQSHRAAAFERRMQCLTENVAVRGRRAFAANAQQPIYPWQAEADVGSAVPIHIGHGPAGESMADSHKDPQQRVMIHRPRKRQARRFDLDTLRYQQSTDTACDPDDDGVQSPVTDVNKPVLQGLGAFGTLYPIDFGIKPLPVGQYFDQDTFVGRGELHDAITLASHNLDVPRGHMSVHLGDDLLTLSAWNEDVSSALARISSTIASLLKQNLGVTGYASSDDDRQTLAYLLRSIIRYCSKCLHFVDRVDRQTCVESLQQFILNLQDAVVGYHASPVADKDVITLILECQVILAYQTTQLSKTESTLQHIRHELGELLFQSARSLRKHALSKCCETLQNWHHGVTSGARCRLDDKHVVHTLVVLNHTAEAQSADMSLWAVVEESLAIDISTSCSIKELDKVWQFMFALLPALCINASGAMQDPKSRLARSTDWTLVRKLIARVFELYENTSSVRGFSVNVYVRSLLHRCHKLIETWCWARCETALYLVYDFFSKQSRMLLKNEECRGSPGFLENLSHRPHLDIMPNDLSFHIFLKMLATGLKVMREQHVYSDRKIGASITYRMIPTHGRTYPKEKDMEQDDVDALRSHHDLLCTLYYASPPGHRAGLEILRNLVDHAQWHRRACQLNIKAWSMLAAFQSATHEAIDEMQPVMAWYTEILRSTVSQHRLARSEAEHDFHHARGNGADITEAFLYGTIATNQLQVALSLADALSGLKRAIEVASSLAIVQTLVRKSEFWTVLELFDTSQRRLVPTAFEALKVIEAALSAEARMTGQVTSQANSSSTDSQEFGDFSALDELVATNDTEQMAHATTAIDLVSPMSSFLSSVLGADHLPDDALLEQSVHVWIRVAMELVKGGTRTWSSYVDEYSPHSWTQMRDTRQKRKLTPYYMSCVIEQASSDHAVRQMVLTSWLCSLVEREAVMKFQHVLTSSLLNVCDDEDLLQNLPFAIDARTGRFQISLEEVRQSRLSLLSVVLSNMRRKLLKTRLDCPMHTPEVKNQYTSMLRQLMNAMKHNYQELQSDKSADLADESLQGAYVEFVQNVISLLQEHTTDFCQIDKFFTDSSVFPLPATDPTYVVGKLRGYALKLEDPGPRRELAMFIQSVNERAALDGQQQYLVTQMASAMFNEAENGDSTAPTLRHVLLTSIVPAYLDSSLNSSCGWVLSLPLLQACRLVLREMLYAVDISSQSSTTTIIETLTTILHSLYGRFDQALTPGVAIGDPAILRLLGAMCDVCTAALTTSSYIQRSTGRGKDLLRIMRALYAQSRGLQQRLQDEAVCDGPENLIAGFELARPWADTRAFAERQVHDAMKFWYEVDGRYYVRRANISKEVKLQLGCSAEEDAALLNAISNFHKIYEATFDVRQSRMQHIVNEDICGMANLAV
ncbi:Putative E3 ubiquitin-protein ligase substrate receptor Mms22 [Septoria linicola]|uniref:E3 ubiquitin-protein ligase substrate receptor Mms22 n=1 Tax=Septoria linicola TaxID=215465 RepID=A0A9Q9AER3_9PEZI|nr:Putative E3 ubiquitin-protein ligase substrate receptor Mms22 [Septoria linicola]